MFSIYTLTTIFSSVFAQELSLISNPICFGSPLQNESSTTALETVGVSYPSTTALETVGVSYPSTSALETVGASEQCYSSDKTGNSILDNGKVIFKFCFNGICNTFSIDARLFLICFGIILFVALVGFVHLIMKCFTPKEQLATIIPITEIYHFANTSR